MNVIRVVLAAAGAVAAAVVLVFLGLPVVVVVAGAVVAGVFGFLALRPRSRSLASSPAPLVTPERRGADRRAGADRRRPNPPPYDGPERRKGERRKGDRRTADGEIRHSKETLLAEHAELEERRAARRARRAADPHEDD
jgi:hypothetical protein